MPRKVPLTMRSVGSSDDGAVIRVATAWLGRAMQWLLVRVRVITLTQTSCAVVRSASEVHNSAESWLPRPQRRKRAAKAWRAQLAWSNPVHRTSPWTRAISSRPLEPPRCSAGGLQPPPQATREESEDESR